MTPKARVNLNTEIIIKKQPSQTYRIDFENGRISGYVDGIEAVKQAVYKILNTERYVSAIYSWNYGIEAVGLYGSPLPYVYSEIKRRITEALVQDDRITEVDNFTFEHEKGGVGTEFTVHTTLGVFNVSKVVAV